VAVTAQQCPGSDRLNKTGVPAGEVAGGRLDGPADVAGARPVARSDRAGEQCGNGVDGRQESLRAVDRARDQQDPPGDETHDGPTEQAAAGPGDRVQPAEDGPGPTGGEW
jgi:hypothetical protein